MLKDFLRHLQYYSDNTPIKLILVAEDEYKQQLVKESLEYNGKFRLKFIDCEMTDDGLNIYFE